MTVRDQDPSGPREVVAAFQRAFDGHDIDGIMGLMTDDCVFDDTTPPDGRIYAGQAAVRRRWETFFQQAPAARFETEETVVSGDRVVVRWRYDWGDGHVRGIDLFRVTGGLVAEKISYVKG
jgi:ketosteroid isomerase-like protein